MRLVDQAQLRPLSPPSDLPILPTVNGILEA